MNEIFKNIKGFGDRYQISNYGRVKSKEFYQKNHSKMQFKPEIILKDADNHNGYRFVGLHFNKHIKQLYVHRLVATYFINEIPQGMEINHIDGVKHNNHVSNLEIVTRSENSLHANRTGLRKSPRGTKCKNNKSGFVNVAPKFVHNVFTWCFTLRKDGKRFERTSRNIYECLVLYNAKARELKLETSQLTKKDVAIYGSGLCCLL